METLTVRITGTSPLLMHSELLCNPLAAETKAHKSVAAKRKKSDDDHLWLLESEWRNGMYHDDKIGPYIPAINLESAIAAGGKIHRLGTTIKQVVQVLDDQVKLEYDGPRKKDAMWKSGEFTDIRGVGVNGKKIMRARPIFKRWSAQFQVAYMEDVIDRGDLVRAIEETGRRIGIGDYRPRFGRFDVEVAK